MPALSSYPDRVLTRALGHDSGNLTGKAFIREVLSADRTYYLRSDGNDSNTGLVDSAGGAFLTHAGAWLAITNSIDFGGKTVTLQKDASTYTTGWSINSGWVGGGAFIYDGGGGTISVPGDYAIQCSVALPGRITVQNVTLTAYNCIDHQGSGIIQIGTGVTFGACTAYHCASQGFGSTIYLYQNYNITGGGGAHMLVLGSGNNIRGGSFTATITGTLTFSVVFAYAVRLGYIEMTAESYTLSGGATVTGTRYEANSNAVIYTGGGGASYFPGTVNGSVNTGGVYA